MLKPAEPPAPAAERPVGELVHQLIEDGKAYAQCRTRPCQGDRGAKAKRACNARGPACRGAFRRARRSINALVVGVVLAPAPGCIGPLLPGSLGLLIFAAIAGGLGLVRGKEHGEALAMSDGSRGRGGANRGRAHPRTR